MVSNKTSTIRALVVSCLFLSACNQGVELDSVPSVGAGNQELDESGVLQGNVLQPSADQAGNGVIEAPTPEPTPEPAPEPTPESVDAYYRPQVLITWQLQLQGIPNTSYMAELIILDLFDTSSEDIAAIQSNGRKVICYFSAGTYEEWRRDASLFNAADLGLALDDWPGERWLDIRSSNVKNIMISRLQLAQEKGCDGVDPDNVDGYSNPTGIDLTDSDQLAFNKFLTNQAHTRGLAIGLKNNVGQVERLAEYYDFAVNESCDRYNECDRLRVFTSQGKPVLHVEYRPELRNDDSALSTFCQRFSNMQFSTLVLPRSLDDEFRLSCQ